MPADPPHELSLPPHKPERRPVSLFFLIVALMLIYNSNFRTVRINDSLPAQLLPFSLLLDHTVYLDRWFPHEVSAARSRRMYYVRHIHGHWLSSYPIILPVLLLPLYVLPAAIVHSQHTSPLEAALLTPLVVETMAKFCASLIAALSAGVLYLALRKKAGANAALIITLIYSLASNTFSTSSQALWRQGFTELCFAFLLWALWREGSAEQRAFWAGLALAAATANKLADVAILLPFLVYFARRSRRELLASLAPMSVLGLLVLAYNLHYFHSLLGGYPNPFLPPMRTFPTGVGRTSFSVGLAGLMASPSRGLLIYAPWTVFALWGAVRMWKQNAYGWARYLIVGMTAVYVLQAKFGQWWGGWCFGPRYMTDLLPFFALFLLAVWEGVRRSKALTAAMVAALGASLWVQVVGVYYYPRGQWDSKPVSVQWATKRLWNWRDTQLSRTWAAGPSLPELPDEWINYFKTRERLNHSQARSQSLRE